jgi:dipeptidyl aminopeptidase/acylaminoacyl peptidase
MAVDYYGFESLPSAQASAAVGDVTPPAPPQGLTATASGPAVSLAWSANIEPDLGGYNIYKKVEQAWNKLNGALVTSTTYTDPNLPNGTYTYRVTAIDQIGNESGPSNEASAQVQIEPPQKPTNVSITPVPEGRALTICWENAGSNVVGYNIYRSTTPGNHYERINTALITDLCFLDDDLVNGTTYYYVVTAVDSLGNESVYSEQAFAIPADIVCYAPVLFYPTINTIPVTLYTETTVISGFAEPGASVQLSQNGTQGDTALALVEDQIQRFTLQNDVDWGSLSPDAKALAYNTYDYTNDTYPLWLQDLATGNTSMIVHNAFLVNWSPDSARIIYESQEENWNFRIGLYDRGTGTTSLLTEDTGADEYYLNWIQGENRLAFISNRGGTYDVWVKDFDTGTLTKVTNGVEMNWSWALLSPNGQRLAYIQGQTISVVDLATGASQVVDSQSPESYRVFAWAPDSTRLAFLSTKGGSSDIYLIDMTTQAIEQLTATPATESWFWWSPDGQALVSGIYTDTHDEVWVIPVKAGKQGRLLLQVDKFSLSYLDWLSNGIIAYMAGNELSVMQPQGLFTFPDVALDIGENVFTAVATDAAGNTSPASEPITLIYETSRLADLEALSEDIVIYPAAPLTGDKAKITIPFRNKGASAAEEVTAEVYMLDSAGNLELVQYESFAKLDAQEEKQISFTWDTSQRTGENMVMVLLDAADQVLEASEDNNFATKTFYVSDKEGITLTATLDAAQYPSNKPVYITVQISNSGPATAGALDVFIEDEQGVKVAQIVTKDLQLPYGKGERYDLVWNTGKTYAAAYRLRAVLRGATGVIAETAVPFTIEPSIAVASSVVTDKASYGPNEEVQAGIMVTNNGQNYTIPLLRVRITITRSGISCQVL